MSPEQFSLQVKVQRVAFLTFGLAVSLLSVLLLSACAGQPAEAQRFQTKQSVCV